jgi:hypothetical protein
MINCEFRPGERARFRPDPLVGGTHNHCGRTIVSQGIPSAPIRRKKEGSFKLRRERRRGKCECSSSAVILSEKTV